MPLLGTGAPCYQKKPKLHACREGEAHRGQPHTFPLLPAKSPVFPSYRILCSRKRHVSLEVDKRRVTSRGAALHCITRGWCSPAEQII